MRIIKTCVFLGAENKSVVYLTSYIYIFYSPSWFF